MTMLSDKAREIAALILLGLALFAFLSTISFTDAVGNVDSWKFGFGE